LELVIIVLAAGQGTRMRSDLPQVLHPVAGWPMLRHVLVAARGLEPSRLIAVVGHRADLVRKELGEDVRAVLQEKQLGTAHAVLRAEAEAAGQAPTVMVLFGDMPLIRPSTLHALLEQHRASGAALAWLSTLPADSGVRGSAVRGPATGCVVEVDGESELPSAQSRPGEAPGGAFCFSDAWLWAALRRLEGDDSLDHDLTDLADLAVREGCSAIGLPAGELEAMAVNDRVALSWAEAEMRRRINERWMLAGVTVVDPGATYIEAGVQIGDDTTLWPGTCLQGSTRIGCRCVVGPGTVVRDSVVGDDCRLELSVLEGAAMDSRSNIGPFSHLRKGAHLGAGAHVGNFGELKNSFLGPGAKMGHFSYLGDATIGENANIGAGTITCNYDGQRKNPTIVGRDAFIGSDTMLVAPVKVGDGARTGAGSVVTHDIPAHAVAYGVPARVRHGVDDMTTEEK